MPAEFSWARKRPEQLSLMQYNLQLERSYAKGTYRYMYSSITVANYFLSKGWEEHVAITPMKLLKLVYVAHGWYLGGTGEPLIHDPIMAWRYGPVIPSLYHEVKKYRSRGITSKIRSAFSSVFEERLDDDAASFLDMIWQLRIPLQIDQ